MTGLIALKLVKVVLIRVFRRAAIGGFLEGHCQDKTAEQLDVMEEPGAEDRTVCAAHVEHGSTF